MGGTNVPPGLSGAEAAVAAKIRLQAEVHRLARRGAHPVACWAGTWAQVAALKRGFPDADPGDVTAHRWRQRFTKVVMGTEFPSLLGSLHDLFKTAR